MKLEEKEYCALSFKRNPFSLPLTAFWPVCQSTSLVQTYVSRNLTRRIATKIFTDIYSSQSMNSADFVGNLPSHLCFSTSLCQFVCLRSSLPYVLLLTIWVCFLVCLPVVDRLFFSLVFLVCLFVCFFQFFVVWGGRFGLFFSYWMLCPLLLYLLQVIFIKAPF